MQDRLDNLANEIKSEADLKALEDHKNIRAAENFKKAAAERGQPLLEEFKNSDTFKLFQSFAKLRLVNLYGCVFPIRNEIIPNPQHIDWGYHTKISPKKILKLEFKKVMRVEKPDIVVGLMHIDNSPQYAIVHSPRVSPLLPSWHFSWVTNSNDNPNYHLASKWSSFYSEDKLVSFAEKQLTDTLNPFGQFINDALIKKAEQNRGTNVVDLKPK